VIWPRKRPSLLHNYNGQIVFGVFFISTNKCLTLANKGKITAFFNGQLLNLSFETNVVNQHVKLHLHTKFGSNCFENEK